MKKRRMRKKHTIAFGGEGGGREGGLSPEVVQDLAVSVRQRLPCLRVGMDTATSWLILYVELGSEQVVLLRCDESSYVPPVFYFWLCLALGALSPPRAHTPKDNTTNTPSKAPRRCCVHRSP